jgi:uncharacterized glyoxalase superfamily protein PhnB
MSVYPTIRYRDARAAIHFLVDALGFTEKSVMSTEDGRISHAELGWDGGVIMLGQKSAEPGTYDTERCCIYLALDDPDAHHAKAVAAGAEVVMELTDQPYGSREYAVRDPEGNTWCFGTYRP